MKYRKLFTALGLLVTMNALANEATISSGIKLEPNFTPRKSDESKDIKSSDFDYTKTSYEVEALNLNVNLNDLGLKLGAIVRSSRLDSKINDWDGDKEVDLTKKQKNHDLAAKLFAEYTKSDIYGLTSTTKLTYYLDDITAKRTSKDGVITEQGSISAYKKETEEEVLGNVLLDTNLKGKFNLTNTDVDASLKYKANQLDRFDKDEAYLKTNIDLKQDFTENLKGSFKHNFDYDLDFSSKIFDPETTTLTEYPDFFNRNYVEKRNQNIESTLGYTNNDLKYGLNTKLDIESYLVRGEYLKSAPRVLYDTYEPSITLSVEKSLNSEFKLRPEIVNDFKIREAIFMPQTEENYVNKFRWAAYMPKLKLAYEYDSKNGEENTLKTSGNIYYGMDMTLEPFTTKSKHFRHIYGFENKTELKHKFDEKLSLEGNLDTNLRAPILNGELNPINFKFNVNTKLKYILDDKTTLNAELDNKTSIKSIYRILNPDNFTEELKLSLGGEYKFFETKVEDKIKEKLTLSSKLEERIKIGFEYYLEDIEKLATDSLVDSEYNKKIVYSMNSAPLYIENTLSLNTALNYEKEVNDKLKITSGAKLNANLDLLALRIEKLYHYKSFEKDLEEGKVKPEVMDYRNFRVNVGGKIEFIPEITFDYNVLNNLNVKTKLASKLEFSREVISKIKDSKRPDNGLYAPIDKEFKFRKLVPSIELGIEYKW